MRGQERMVSELRKYLEAHPWANVRGVIESALLPERY